MADVGVLVVDDHQAFRRAVGATLARTDGFTMVGEATDGADIVGAAESTGADLVLMDVNMPVVDGIRATRRLLAARPHTVVILCSTYRLEELPEAAGTSGARAYVNKKDLSPQMIARLWAQVAAAGSDEGMIIG